MKITMYFKVQKVIRKGRDKITSFIGTSHYSPNVVIAKLSRTWKCHIKWQRFLFVTQSNVHKKWKATRYTGHWHHNPNMGTNKINISFMLLTVHSCIIFFKWSQLGAHYFLVYLFQLLYMFQANMCQSSAELSIYLYLYIYFFVVGYCRYSI